VRESELGRQFGQHAVVQAFYYELLSRRERQELHRRAGEYYEIAEPDALKAALHFARAGEHARAARLATEDVWAIVNQGHARALRRLLEQFAADQVSAEQWLALTFARGEVYTFLRESALARESYQTAFDLVAALSDSPLAPEYKARICRGIGELLEYESPQEALAWLRRGLDEAAGRSAYEEARLLHRIGSVLIATGEHDAARAALEQSLGLLASEAGEPRADVLMDLGVISCFQGQLERGREYFLEAMAIYQRFNNIRRIAGLWINLARIKDITGDWASAVAEYGRALDLAKQMGSTIDQVLLELQIGILHVKQGDDETAQAHLSACLRLAHDHNLKEYIVSSQSSLADLYIRQGAWDAAEGALSAADRLMLEIDARWQQPEIEWLWSQVYLASGQAPAAFEHAQRAVDIARELGLEFEMGMSLRALGQALLAAGRRPEALEAFAQSLERLADDPYEAARTRMQWGRALIVGPEQEQGMTLLKTARAAFIQLEARRDLADLETSTSAPGAAPKSESI